MHIRILKMYHDIEFKFEGVFGCLMQVNNSILFTQILHNRVITENRKMSSLRACTVRERRRG